MQVEPSLSHETSRSLAMKGKAPLSGPPSHGHQSFAKEFADVDRGITIDISHEKMNPEQRNVAASHVPLRGTNSTTGGSRHSASPDLGTLAAQHVQEPGASSRGLQTAFNESIMGAIMLSRSRPH